MLLLSDSLPKSSRVQQESAHRELPYLPRVNQEKEKKGTIKMTRADSIVVPIIKAHFSSPVPEWEYRGQ